MGKLTEQELKELLFSEAKGNPSEYNEAEITLKFYVLDPTRMTTETVCNVDDRKKVTATTLMPYKAICKLYMRSPSGKNYVGTGWLTHSNKLYTAGHCVYDREVSAWMSSIIVVPGLVGFTEPYGRYYAAELASTRGWVESGSARYDMGAIKLTSPVNHNEFLIPALGDPATGEVSGYPADRDTGIFQYQMIDTLTKVGGQFNYMLDTFGGQSGAPLLQDRIRAVGIHNYGGCPNSASDLYQEFVEGINRW